MTDTTTTRNVIAQKTQNGNGNIRVPDLTLLSSGFGVQSTTLGLLAIEGTLPKPDAVISSDTGWEPEAVYTHLTRFTAALKVAGIPTYLVSRGDLRADHLDAAAPFSSMPLFVRGQDGRAALGRRQCTHDYKLRPVREKTRELLGYPKPARVRRGVYADTWIGFSTDEVYRINSNRSPGYARLSYPLIDLGMSRTDCLRYLRVRGWQVPKSACVGCPFHDDLFWRTMRDERPAEWADAVEFDAAIRNAPKNARSRIRSQQYLHRTLLPLDQAPIDVPSRRELRAAQTDLVEMLLDDAAEADIKLGCSPYGCSSGTA